MRILILVIATRGDPQVSVIRSTWAKRLHAEHTVKFLFGKGQQRRDIRGLLENLFADPARRRHVAGAAAGVADGVADRAVGLRARGDEPERHSGADRRSPSRRYGAGASAGSTGHINAAVRNWQTEFALVSWQSCADEIWWACFELVHGAVFAAEARVAHLRRSARRCGRR